MTRPTDQPTVTASTLASEGKPKRVSLKQIFFRDLSARSDYIGYLISQAFLSTLLFFALEWIDDPNQQLAWQLGVVVGAVLNVAVTTAIRAVRLHRRARLSGYSQ